MPGNVEVIPTPGHTRGSVCFLAGSAEGKKYLFTGDSLFLAKAHGPHASIREAPSRISKRVSCFCETSNLTSSSLAPRLVPFRSRRFLQYRNGRRISTRSSVPYKGHLR